MSSLLILPMYSMKLTVLLTGSINMNPSACYLSEPITGKYRMISGITLDGFIFWMVPNRQKKTVSMLLYPEFLIGFKAVNGTTMPNRSFRFRAYTVPPLVHNTNFVGRASELNEIYRLLHSDNNKLFLCGTGGIGKSELARQYGLKFQNEYRTILWFTYNSTLEDMIITDQFLLIHGLENEKQDLTTPQARETYYYKKLNYLKEHCDKRTLLIIDNFDAEDERTQELLEGPYSVIFTTRISREKDGYQELSIHPMDNPEDLIALFQKFYKRPLQSGDDMILLQIF